MQSIQRYVAIGLILVALLVTMLMATGFEWVWTYMAWEDFNLVGRQFRLTTVLGIVAGFGGGLYIWLSIKWRGLLNEVAEELAKVTWPTRDETMSATVVVVITVFIFAAFLGMFDAIFLWLTNILLNIPNEALA